MVQLECISFSDLRPILSAGYYSSVTNMNRALQITVTCVALLVVLPGASSGGLITSGDLNIIDDVGNPSNGLRYLDTISSVGLNLAQALAMARANYSDCP